MKKNIINKTMVLLLATALLVTGCTRSKDEVVSTSSANQQQEMTASRAMVTPENGANPYDKVGRMHNVLLDSAMTFINRTGETDINKVAEYVLECNGIAPSYRKYIDKMPARLKDELFNDHNKLIDESKFSPEAKSLLHELLSAISVIKFPEFGSLKSNIVILERKITASLTLAQQEKQMLLSVTSVARYSAYYWFGWWKQQNDQQAQALSASVFEKIGAAIVDMIDADNLAIFCCAVDGTPPILWAPMSALKSLDAFRRSFLGN